MKIYDTLTAEKHDFVPVAGEVRFYVCGVTPYAPAHVGHAMSYIIFDVLRRYLEFRGYRVRHVQNFTDVDDKLIERANREGTTVEALAERHIEDFFRDMGALNVRRAHVYPRASAEVPKMVEIIGGLIEKDFAYPSDGDVYFRVTRDPAYGKLSHRSLDGMRAGARIEASKRKEHPMDFALWKAAKPGEPSWESPWGPGRPGWHIECTAMAVRYLGGTIDIHGGGQDLVFPHHENEIAQSEAFTGQAPFARFWVHNGLLHLDQEKMSKSLGNLVSITNALSNFSADALRFSVLNSHYRSPGGYSEEALASAERAVARLREAATLAGPAGYIDTGGTTTGGSTGGDTIDPAPYRERFILAMDDDFNTPQALAALFDLSREINRAAESAKGVADAQGTLLELGRDVLGFTFEAPEVAVPPELTERIQALVDERTAARAARDFVQADRLRDELAALNVTLTDTADGTQWRLAARQDPSAT